MVLTCWQVNQSGPVGFGTKADVLTAYSLDYNGNGITVSNDIWKQMKPNVKKDATGKVIHPITADSLKPIADEAKTIMQS